jgi:hypothetical protein
MPKPKRSSANLAKSVTPLRDALRVADVPIFDHWLAHAESPWASFLDRSVAVMEALRDPYLQDTDKRSSLIGTMIRNIEDALGGTGQIGCDAALVLTELLEHSRSYTLDARHIKMLKQLRELANDLDVRLPSKAQQQRLLVHREKLADTPVRARGTRIDIGSRLPVDGSVEIVPRRRAEAMFGAREAMNEFCALLPNLPPAYDAPAGDYLCAPNILKRARELLMTMRVEIDEFLQTR